MHKIYRNKWHEKKWKEKTRATVTTEQGATYIQEIYKAIAKVFTVRNLKRAIEKKEAKSRY